MLPKGVCDQILTCVNLNVLSGLYWCREEKYQQAGTLRVIVWWDGCSNLTCMVWYWQ